MYSIHGGALTLLLGIYAVMNSCNSPCTPSIVTVSSSIGTCTRDLLPAGRALRARPAGPKITLPFPRLYICASALITCAIITSHTLLPCDLTYSRLQQFRRLLCIAAMSSLPQLQLRDGYREAEAT